MVQGKQCEFCGKPAKGKSRFCSDSCRAKASHARRYVRKKEREKDGKFKAIQGAKIDDKGYLSITAGPCRGKRVHTLIMEAKLGRKLKPDEDVHHKNGIKLDVSPDNLEVLGHREHGAVSSRQHWYLKAHDIKLEAEFNAYFEEGGKAT